MVCGSLVARRSRRLEEGEGGFDGVFGRVGQGALGGVMEAFLGLLTD